MKVFLSIHKRRALLQCFQCFENQLHFFFSLPFFLDVFNVFHVVHSLRCPHMTGRCLAWKPLELNGETQAFRSVPCSRVGCPEEDPPPTQCSRNLFASPVPREKCAPLGLLTVMTSLFVLDSSCEERNTWQQEDVVKKKMLGLPSLITIHDWIRSKKRVYFK